LSNIRFVGNLIGDMCWNIYNDDVIIMMSLVLRTQSVSATFCPAVFFYNSPSVKQHAGCKKSEQVQQANVFKCKTLMFHFHRIGQIHLNVYTVYQ